MSKDTQAMLQAKFPADEVKCRMGATTGDKTKGMPLFYIDARAVQHRLDEVFGWDGWKAEYREIGSKGVICRLSVKTEEIGPEAWLPKEDGAGETDIEATKGGISDALRRVAASGYGIGRYLYDVKADWVPIVQHGNSYRFASNPQLPPSALPAGAMPVQQPKPVAEPVTQPEPTQDVFDEAVAVAAQPAPPTPPPPQNDVVPPCPECGGPMWDNRADPSKSVVFKCKAGKWDRETKTASGCQGLVWRSTWLKQQSASGAPAHETVVVDPADIPF